MGNFIDDVADFGGTLLGTNTSVAGTMGATAFGSATDYYNNKRLMERQHGFTKEQMQNQYQWMVNDLRRAGLNPMLAVSKNASAPTGAGGRTSQPDFLGAYKVGQMMDAQLAKLRAETQLIRNKGHITQPFGEMGGALGDFIRGVKESSSSAFDFGQKMKNMFNQHEADLKAGKTGVKSWKGVKNPIGDVPDKGTYVKRMGNWSLFFVDGKLVRKSYWNEKGKDWNDKHDKRYK